MALDAFAQMRDVATSETFREERAMKRRQPRAFWMQGLRPSRRYAIEFEGVSNNKDRTGERRRCWLANDRLFFSN